MKLLRREFTWKEKLLLVLLALLLLGGLYYFAVDRPVRSELSKAQAKLGTLEKERLSLQKKKQSLTKMQKELDYLEKDSTLAAMGSYNNLEAELAELNDILTLAQKYDIDFTKTTREGNLIRKYFTISCSTNDYQDAEALIEGLYNFPYRCMISDIKVSSEEKGKDLQDSMVLLTISAVFYETLYEGTIDSGVPADSGK